MTKILNTIVGFVMGTLISLGFVLAILILFLVCIPIILYVSITESLKFLLNK